MTHIQSLVRENVRLLEQARALIEELGDGLYAKPAAALALSGVGNHMRHCIDFYAAFLGGLGNERLDYDRRERDARLEADAPYASERLATLIRAFERVGASGPVRGLRVKTEASEGADEARWSHSSLARELQFLCSHTVHHFALIGVILRFHGRDPGPEFGVAPSTLAYWKEEARACAP